MEPFEGLTRKARKLPHWELAGGVYFVTFSTVPGFALSPGAKDITLSSLRFHSGSRYTLFAGVVMDTHVHAILQPLGETGASQPEDSVCSSLASVMHSLKSYSAHAINRSMGRRGAVWLPESYDRVLRGEEEFLDKLRYIVENPLKAGFVERPEEYRWLVVEGLG